MSIIQPGERRVCTIQVTAVLTPHPTGGFVAHDPATGTITQADDIAEALANLREAVELFLE